MSSGVIKRVSAGGVLFHDNHYLTIKWASQNTIELPKGTIELGETAEQACVREMLEETGYNVEVTHPLGESTFVFQWKDGKMYEKTVHYFLMKRVDDAEPKPRRQANEDFYNLWLAYDDAVQQLTHDDMREVVKKARDVIAASQSL